MIVPIRPDVRVRGSWAVNYHHVTMTVRDQVASVSIDQEFVNTGGGMIEVEYLFPVPPDAAIDSMTLVVDGKEMTARLMKADEARRIYEDIVRRKKDPALLEYAGFGLYRTKAFPLEPNKPAKVIVHYNCVCKKDHDLVEVWYPLNTEKFSARPIKDVKVTADIKADSDISAVYSPTHDLSVERKDARHVVATYHATDVIPATDIQIFYRPSNDAVAATLLTYMPDKSKDGYFMMLASPNPRSSQSKAVPKDVVLVLDHSGSMSGEKIEQARAAAAFVLKNLNDADRFNVVVYNDIVEPFFEEMVPADKAHLDEAADRLDRVEAGSGTNIDEALTCAMKMVRSDGERPAYVIFMTDGLPTVGKTDEGAILADTKEANAAGARLFAFGMGYDVNVRLLDKLVGANSGKSDYVKPNESIETKIASLYAKIKNPVMTSLEVSLAGVKLRDMYPREIGDLFDGDQVVLVGRYEGGGESTLVIKGVYEGKDRAFEYPVTVRDDADSRYAFVEKLWAMRRVGWLMDQVQLHGESKEVIDELVALSEKHGIITPYTSFLADESLKLSDRPAVMGRMETNALDLGREYKGGRGQAAAMARQKLNFGMQAPARGPASAGVQMFGQSSMDKYEAGEVEMLTNVRQAGNQAVYRRGKVWIASNATRIDLDKDQDQVVDVERFSTEYFKLVEANTVEENQLLASQQEGEELVVSLRGQVYRIK
jgi:Ca-activated chloride channel family protein